ncbi:hypothetical protein RHGRI_025287 [Rhododendron griersonianum]|uniref:non-specific serine/threonine protein kinase n=1 Tax=Rhododendron griersonianum TaxID=479676 RepID=A0AAV6JFG8_9ERIC|nr:hypothetical protein RHGRI_025287 [Rhododendron griersonianum]
MGKYVTDCLCANSCYYGRGEKRRDADALLKFKDGLSNNVDALGSWNNSTSPCSGNYANWIGVLCTDGDIWGLQLENMGLTGDIDVDALLLLPHLRTLSFTNNKFDGDFPDFYKLGALKSLFLSNNQFSGSIPDNAFAGMASLKKLYLSHNAFQGNVPTSLAQLPKLIELRLEGNQFTGLLPNFQQKDLRDVNVSYNQLEGPIPPALINVSPTSFSGNKDLCGKPLDSVCKSSELNPNPPNSSSNVPSPSSVPTLEDAPNKKTSTLKIAMIVIVCGVALAAIIVLLIIYCRSRNQTSQLGRPESSSYKHSTSLAAAASLHTAGLVKPTELSCRSSKKGVAAAELGKLSFVRDDRERFDLQDLLRASAEVLGSGNFGSSYKAVLLDGQAVVVKRFKLMNNVGREEFHEHMRRLGRLRHPNLLPLVAYYYRKEEKLLVFDFVHNGSLASHLHGNHSVEQPGLDWPARLKIVKGVARGLVHLQSELPSLIVAHGHLKSSNVLLNEVFEPLLMDYTLAPLVNQEHAQQILVAYKSPEYAQHGRTTKKTDVWSLGILILEILTGKFPANYLAQGTGNLASWVDSIVKDQETARVFDEEMGSYAKNGTAEEEEMLRLFKIGVACCQEDVEKRLDLKEAVEKIEELKESHSDIVVDDHV